MVTHAHCITQTRCETPDNLPCCSEMAAIESYTSEFQCYVHAGATPADVAARKGNNAVAVYLTNIVSGTQSTPSKAELIDERVFAWSYAGLDSNPVHVDMQGSKPAQADDKGNAPAKQISITASAGLPQANAQQETVAASAAGATSATNLVALRKAAAAVARRPFYGYGTPGTKRKFTVPVYRVIGFLTVRFFLIVQAACHASCLLVTSAAC